MKELTSKERISRILKLQPVDRIGVFESFWNETVDKWRKDEYLQKDEMPEDHFKLDIRGAWPFNLVANLQFKEEIIEETDETKLVRNGNGAVLRWWKNKAGTPEHVDFAIKDRLDWEETIRPLLMNKKEYHKRINFEEYRRVKERSKKEKLFFCWYGVNVFESMHPICGHENLLMGMALDTEWIMDMCSIYSELTINLMDILFAEEGKPDGIWFFEDMGFKGKPFMSPAMYKDIIWPAHKKTFDYAHSMDLPVIVHSCGFVEALLPGLVEAGMDCLQAMEVKAGMDIVKLKKQFGNKIAFMGGFDIRSLETNDFNLIQSELEKKLPIVMQDGGYILHSDHSIPDQVNFETYKYFVERGLEIGTYK
ncbi:MAG: hypothetical protein KAH17_00745 [Bacteroidales bacterium]|nr:hypothetical protein [Bacteroidales bacterium]